MQDFINDPKKYGASQVAWGIALFVAGTTMLGRLGTNGINELWASALYSFCAGLSAWGITFAISYTTIHILPGLSVLLDPSLAKPKQAKQQTKRIAQNVTVETMPEERELDWRENLERHILDNGMFRVRNTQRLLNQNFKIEWLYWLAETKWEGDLPHVSANYLHSRAGIDRYTGHPNSTDKTPSEQVIEFLESFNLVTKEGQIYKWTIAGEDVFPTSPTFE